MRALAVPKREDTRRQASRTAISKSYEMTSRKVLKGKRVDHRGMSAQYPQVGPVLLAQHQAAWLGCPHARKYPDC